jgi:hypothetical protein
MLDVVPVEPRAVVERDRDGVIDFARVDLPSSAATTRCSGTMRKPTRAMTRKSDASATWSLFA